MSTLTLGATLALLVLPAARPAMAPAMAAMAPAALAPADAMAPAPDEGGEPADPDGPAEEDYTYRPVQVEVVEIVWYGPGQQGLIEAHPLVMGLAVMALATVTLLFFFLRGIKRRGDDTL